MVFNAAKLILFDQQLDQNNHLQSISIQNNWSQNGYDGNNFNIFANNQCDNNKFGYQEARSASFNISHLNGNVSDENIFPHDL